MTEDLLTWPGRGSTFENGPGALSSDCAMVGHRDSLWPGSFSHTVAQRERSVPTGEDSQASWGSVRQKGLEQSGRITQVTVKQYFST